MEFDDNADDADADADQSAMFTWFKLLSALVHTQSTNNPVVRNAILAKQKLIWNEYVNNFSSHPTFIRKHLRMTLASFYKLLSYVKEGLEVDNAQANKRGGVILPEICLFCTLRWLAGGSYLDICALTGVSTASFYRIVYRTLRLIIDSKELEIKLPATKEECIAAAAGFRSISYKEAITNCIGVLDGYLLRIITPPKDQAGNVRSYYSGHYKCYGLNIQAVCDHQSRFIFFAIAAPGSTNDRDAVKETGLLQHLEKLPKVFVIIGDAAYEPSE
jgi:hypothetical protein